jgi:hypothetical protein
MNVLLMIALVSTVSSGLLLWFLDERLLSRLRVSHPEIWQALGPPNRYFDCWGITSTNAVEELCRRSDLLSRCSADIFRLAMFVRLYHRGYRVAGSVGLAALGYLVWRTS